MSGAVRVWTLTSGRAGGGRGRGSSGGRGRMSGGVRVEAPGLRHARVPLNVVHKSTRGRAEQDMHPEDPGQPWDAVSRERRQPDV